MPQPAVLACSKLRKEFRQGPVTLTVLDGVEFSVAAGERVAIIGASGSGKTTLLQLLGGLDDPTAGSVWIDGQALVSLDETARGRLRNRAVGFVYQFHHLLPEFSAVENVVMPQLIAGKSRADAEARARQLLDRLGLTKRASHRPAELSGGEQQRVAIARALANQPLLLLADEPTGNLDPETAGRVHGEFLSLIRDEGLAALIATHNLELARSMSRVVQLQGGQLVEI